MGNLFNIFSKSSESTGKGLPFGGKRHTLTAEDRAKAAATRKAKAEARKAAKAEAKAAAKQTKVVKGGNVTQVYFASELHERFNFLCKLPEADWKVYGRPIQGDLNRFVGRISLDIPHVRKLDREGYDFMYVLVHRESGQVLVVVGKGDQLAFCVSEEIADSLKRDLEMLTVRAMPKQKKGA